MICHQINFALRLILRAAQGLIKRKMGRDTVKHLSVTCNRNLPSSGTAASVSQIRMIKLNRKWSWKNLGDARYKGEICKARSTSKNGGYIYCWGSGATHKPVNCSRKSLPDVSTLTYQVYTWHVPIGTLLVAGHGASSTSRLHNVLSLMVPQIKGVPFLLHSTRHLVTAF
jgi:hypothetical protein